MKKEEDISEPESEPLEKPEPEIEPEPASEPEPDQKMEQEGRDGDTGRLNLTLLDLLYAPAGYTSIYLHTCFLSFSLSFGVCRLQF